MRKQARWIRWLLLPVVVAAVMFAVEGICNLSLLRLPQEQRGEIALDLSQLAVTTSEPQEEGYLEEDLSAGLYLPQGAVWADVDWTGYVHQLRLTGTAYAEAPYVISCTLEDGTVATCLSTFVSTTAADTIQINQQVTHLQLFMENGDVTLTSLTIVNTARLNPARMLFTGLTAAALYLLWVLRNLIGKKPEYGFLIVALCSCVFLSAGMPTTTGLSYDDQIHFQKAWDLSFGKNVTLTTSVDALANLTYATNEGYSSIHTQDTYEDNLRLAQQLDAPESADLSTATYSYQRQWSLTDTGYVTQALGLAAARWMGLPLHGQIIAARLCNMLGYVLLCFAAIRVLKRFRLTFAAIALMPTPIFLACNFSYDPTCMGLCMLGTALMLDAILDRKTPLTWKRLLAIFVTMFLGCTVKAVYAPLLLMMLMMPRSKFASKGQEIYVKIISMAILLVSVGGILLDISGDINVIQDSRGDGADSAAQVAFILSHPFTYFSYFISTLWTYFQSYLLDAHRIAWAYVGNCSGTWAALSLMLLLFTCYTDNDAALGQRVSWQQRIGFLLVAGVTIGLVFTAMYVGFSAVGSNSFSGVQGRYLLPALPLLALLLSPNGVKNEMNKTGWHLIFCLSNLAILMATCAELVLIPLLL